MAFTLQITFTGLCLFAADKAKKQLHVLLPKIDPATGIEKHFAVVRYDDRRPGMPRIEHSVENRTITIPSVNGSVVLPAKKGMVDLGKHLWHPRRKVLRALETGGVGSVLSTRIILNGGGNPIFSDRKGVWQTVWRSDDGLSGKKPLPAMSPSVMFTTTVDDSLFRLNKYADSKEHDDLTPVDGVVDLEIRNVISSELGDTPVHGTNPIGRLHFPAYFPLFAKSAKPPLDPPMLEWVGEEIGKGLRVSLMGGMTPFTCMIGGGEFE